MIASLFIGFTSIYIAARNYSAERTAWHLISKPATVLQRGLQEGPAMVTMLPLRSIRLALVKEVERP